MKRRGMSRTGKKRNHFDIFLSIRQAPLGFSIRHVPVYIGIAPLDKRISQHLKSALARPPTYDRVHRQKLSTASPGNLIGVTKPSLLSLFVQLDVKVFGKIDKGNGNQFFTVFGIKFTRKDRSESKLVTEPTVVHVASSVRKFNWYSKLRCTLRALNYR